MQKTQGQSARRGIVNSREPCFVSVDVGSRNLAEYRACFGSYSTDSGLRNAGVLRVAATSLARDLQGISWEAATGTRCASHIRSPVRGHGGAAIGSIEKGSSEVALNAE